MQKASSTHSLLWIRSICSACFAAAKIYAFYKRIRKKKFMNKQNYTNQYMYIQMNRIFFECDEEKAAQNVCCGFMIFLAIRLLIKLIFARSEYFCAAIYLHFYVFNGRNFFLKVDYLYLFRWILIDFTNPRKEIGIRFEWEIIMKIMNISNQNGKRFPARIVRCVWPLNQLLEWPTFGNASTQKKWIKITSNLKRITTGVFM